MVVPSDRPRVVSRKKIMAEPRKRIPEDLIHPEEIKDRVIARLLAVAGFLSGLADETEECSTKDMAATLALSRE